MTRSYRKHPIIGWTTAKSEKHFKRIINKKNRLHTKKCISQDKEINNLISHSWPKDGKIYLGWDYAIKYPEMKNFFANNLSTQL